MKHFTKFEKHLQMAQHLFANNNFETPRNIMTELGLKLAYKKSR